MSKMCILHLKFRRWGFVNWPQVLWLPPPSQRSSPLWRGPPQSHQGGSELYALKNILHKLFPQLQNAFRDVKSFDGVLNAGIPAPLFIVGLIMTSWIDWLFTNWQNFNFVEISWSILQLQWWSSHLRHLLVLGHQPPQGWARHPDPIPTLKGSETEGYAFRTVRCWKAS